MIKPEQSLPGGGPSREQIARRDLGHTTVSRDVVRLLLAFFLAVIALVPIAELAVARARRALNVDTDTAWSQLFRIPREVRFHVAGFMPSAQESGLWQLVVSTNRIVLAGMIGFERMLEDESLLGGTLRPPAQLVMTDWLRAGNERVYIGRDNWVFFREDVEYLTGRRFLDPAQVMRRVAAAPEWTAPPQPDPRRAIVQFRDDLAARGITLVVMPTPLKPGVHPEMLSRRYTGATGVLQNESYRSFVDDLRKADVVVFDPSEMLATARRSGPQYLISDTHWRPETMEAVAEQLAGFIAEHAPLPVVADPGYQVERSEVSNAGDIARMLDLPGTQRLFPPESVWLRRILQPDGTPWASSRDADVLVLGDSFANIYALESMGWGTSAGLVEQLSYTLRRPLDRLVQNDEGSFATRALISMDPDRLNGKRVVVYQFAARELAFGDWKEIRF
jgi:hypothetical protein